MKAGEMYILTCNSVSWGTDCTVSTYFIFRGHKLISNGSVLTFAPFKVSDINHYSCIATVNGFNFTSNPTLIQFSTVPAPEVEIRSNMDNPIESGSYPTLTCTIRLDPSVDTDFDITIAWNGPVYGFGKYIETGPVVNSSAEVPTYTSTAALNADRTFYDSGQYRCSAKVSPSLNSEFLWGSASTTSPRIQGKYQYSMYLLTYKLPVICLIAL